MKPYYDDGNGIQIFLGDCREVLPSLPPVDLVLTDPPYGIVLENHGRSETDYSVVGDDDQSAALAVLNWCHKDKMPHAFFFSPYNTFPVKWRNILVWDKGPAVGGGGDIATCWKPTFELIGVNCNKPLNGNRDEAVRRHYMSPNFRMDHRAHHMAKPVDLLAYLIFQLSGPGETVLDPFVGSGTTLRAAKDQGRKAIGIEIEEKYAEIAANRLAQGVFDFTE